MAQEEFHEIQLNGKQLVFLFMAGTVAAVVIFLCGLMVGRNLRAPRLEAAAVTAETTIIDPTRPPDAVPPASSSASTDGTAPASVNEELTYAERLDGPTPPEETLREDDAPPRAARVEPKPAAKTPVAPPKASAATAKVEPPKEAATPKEKSVLAAPPEPPGNGWAVQVQAVKTRDEADAIARRLSAKGYRSFVTTRGAGIYGVRVGKFSDKREAEAIKTRLEKEEQFKPWVTR